MNKNSTTERTLNSIKSLCAERDSKEDSRLEANRLERLKREEAERERMQNTNSILNSYIEKAKKREERQSQERGQMAQIIRDDCKRRREEDNVKSREMSSAIKGSLRNSLQTEYNASMDFLNKHKRLLDKGRETIKREQSKTYFS